MKPILSLLLLVGIGLALSACTGYQPQPGLTKDTNGCSYMVTQGNVKVAAGFAGAVEVCKLSVTGDCFTKQTVDLDKLRDMCESLD